MRLEIITRTSIDTDTGETKSVSTWRIEGDVKGLGSSISQVVARLHEKAAEQPKAQADEPSRSDDRPAGSPPARAEHLAGLVKVPLTDLAEAIRTRPMGRILEVLEWMKNSKSRTPIKLPSALFWTLVNRD